MLHARLSTACALLAALLLAATPVHAGPKEYTITGSVIAVSDAVVTLQTRVGGTNWEIGRDASTKAPDTMKVGDRVTIHYTMTASIIEPKPEKAAKKPPATTASPAAAASSSPSASPSPAH